jgi:YegS/Rv2252/BmrU family lipid kinase
MPAHDYAIIFNPTSAAGRSKKGFNLMKKTLEGLQISYKLFETEHFRHAITLGEELARDGYRVIGAGGDGTCNEVLNGVMNAKSNVLIGFVPMGTGNDIPGAIGYRPKDVKRACEVIAEGYTAPADVGVSINKDGDKRYFLGIGSQGFDALVTKRTNEGSKWLPGTWNYIASVLHTVFSFKRRKIKVTFDNESWTGRANLVAVGNAPTYGGFMYICPRAVVNDGLFHISIVDMGTMELLNKFNTMYKRTLHPDPNIFEFISKTVKIEMENPEDESYFGQVDGEIIGSLPITYDMLPDGYTFIRPREDEAEQWFQEKYGKKFKKHCEKLQQTGSDYWKGRYYE